MPPRKLGQVAATRAALVTALMLAATAAAQEVGARRTGAAVTSPEVAQLIAASTFRLLATEAKAVTVSGAISAPTPGCARAMTVSGA